MSYPPSIPPPEDDGASGAVSPWSVREEITPRERMTPALSFWYVLQCICLGAGYFAKIPAKKAMVEVGLGKGMTSAESFWYVCMCIAFGAGYFAKVPVRKALSELPR